MPDPAGRLVLGTAQLGLDYGIANKTGQPDANARDALLELAYREGMRTLDTAQAYGNSETVIGDFVSRHPDKRFRVVTKIGPAVATATPDQIMQSVRGSRERLGGADLVVMLHDAAMLGHWEDGLGHGLYRCRDSGLIEAIGVSVYDVKDFARALELDDVALIQAPFNVLDRQLLDSRLIDRARAAQKEIHLRSVYLQGLLLLDEDEIAAKVPFASKAIAEWRSVRGAQAEADHLALRFVLDAVPDASIVVGCESPAQLARNIEIARSDPLDADTLAAVRALPAADEQVIRPHLWS